MLLLICGWRKTSEHLVSRCAPYLNARLKDRGIIHIERLSEACSLSLSQLAYRRARKEPDDLPRFIHFARELDKVSDAVVRVLSGYEINDREVRGILTWHGVDCSEENQELLRYAGVREAQTGEFSQLPQSNADGPSFARVVRILVIGFVILAGISTIISFVRR